MSTDGVKGFESITSKVNHLMETDNGKTMIMWKQQMCIDDNDLFLNLVISTLPKRNN